MTKEKPAFLSPFTSSTAYNSNNNNSRKKKRNLNQQNRNLSDLVKEPSSRKRNLPR